MRDGYFFGGVVSGIPDGNIGVLGERGEPGQVAIGFVRPVDIARVSENSINDVDGEIRVAGNLDDLGIVGLAVYSDVEQGMARSA